MAQQRRVKPAVGVAAVGLGIGAGAFGLFQGATADPPRTTWVAPATAASLLAEGRELVRQNRLAEALAKADAAAKLGGATAPGGDTAAALRQDAVADGKTQIEELTAQAKVLATRGDTVRTQASLELARQIATEIGQPTAPPSSTVSPVKALLPLADSPTVLQAVVFHPADPAPPVVAPPAVPTLPSLPLEVIQPPSLPAPPALPPVEVSPAVPSEKLLLPAPPALSLTPSGLVAPPAVPDAGESPPAPGATPVTLHKLAAAAVGAALAAAPLSAQDATPKPGPGSESVVQSMPGPTTPPAAAPAPVAVGASKEQFDALRTDIDGLKEYKRQVQDLLQGKADGAGRSVLDAGVLKRMTDLEEKLDRIEKAVESMRSSVARLEPGRVALSPAAPAPMPAAATKTAVRLVNDYPSELSLILNGASHRLKPGETKSVDVSPGSFTYELIADGAKPITRTIRDDETVTLRIK